MDKTFCDRCGKEIPDNTKFFAVELDELEGGQGRVLDGDLCNDCAPIIQNFLEVELSKKYPPKEEKTDIIAEAEKTFLDDLQKTLGGSIWRDSTDGSKDEWVASDQVPMFVKQFFRERDYTHRDHKLLLGNWAYHITSNGNLSRRKKIQS